MFSTYTNIVDLDKSLVRVNEFYQVEEVLKESQIINESINSISLNDISYSYLSKRDVLVNLNLTLNACDKVLITGDSGCGKTTLIKIVAGYLTEYTGKILINSKEDIGIVGYLRNKVVYTGGSDSLLNMSIKDNILLGRKIDEDKFNNLCNILKLDSIVNKYPLKYDMEIEESGANLSGGERQRILIARSLLNSGDIYIFDESFSNLDISIEREILSNILSYLDKKIVIVISHRFYNEDLFMRKVYLKGGQIYEDDKR